MNHDNVNPTALRIYASELDALRAMEAWLGEAAIFPRVDVRWNEGCACAGYSELSRAISKLVTHEFRVLAERAVEAQRKLVDEAGFAAFGEAQKRGQ